MIILARFILKGPGQAAMTAAVMAILGLIFMPASWLSAAAVALVVLVSGARDGARVMVYAILGSAVLTLVVFSRPELSLFFILLVWLPVWLPAVVLRQTVSMAYSLLLITALAIAASLVFYVMLPGFEESYNTAITDAIRQVLSQYGIEIGGDDLREVIELVLKLLPGLVISSLMFGTMASLLLARWWQAVMFNPGGFADEFQSLRLGKSSALMATLILVAAIMLQTDSLIALSMMVCTLYLLQGTALLHALVNGMKLNSVWLFTIYALIFFVPHVILLMIMAGIADAYIDFRRRLVAG